MNDLLAVHCAPLEYVQHAPPLGAHIGEPRLASSQRARGRLARTIGGGHTRARACHVGARTFERRLLRVEVSGGVAVQLVLGARRVRGQLCECVGEMADSNKQNGRDGR